MKINGAVNIPIQQPRMGANVNISGDKAPVDVHMETTGVSVAKEFQPESEFSKEAKISGEELKIIDRSVKQANKTLKMNNRYIEREIHEKTGAIMYKVRDSKTNEVIAEFPPKKIQDMIAKMWELAGMFVDERA